MKHLLNHLKTLGIIGATFLIVSCDADVEIDRSFDEILSAQPSISSFSPSTATILEEVTIVGTHLNFVTKAYIGDVEASISQRVNQEELRILVPPQAQNGSIRLVTQAEMEVTSEESMSIQYLEPDITSEVPEESIVNENIVLEGKNMNAISKVSFGESEGIIEYKDENSIVIKTPNNVNSPMDLKIWFYSPQGEISENLVDAYFIVIPRPGISVWPSLISRYQDVTVIGENMNLIENVSVGGVETPIISSTANSIIFAAPAELETGHYDITFSFAEGEEITQEAVPYINGELEVYYDWDTYTEEDVDLDLSKDPLAVHQVNASVPQPPLPNGSGYYHLEMGTATGSTIARVQFHKTAENVTWQNILDDGEYGNNPVLHMWVHTENTEPILKIYIGGTGSSNRRELTGSKMNTGDEWRLVAVRLKDFIPDLTSTGSVMELRFNTGSSADIIPSILNLDWIIVTDKVLTEFGAVDVTDEFKSAG